MCEKHQLSTKDQDRLRRGWECITKEKKLMDMCKEHAVTIGAGLSSFVFKKPTETGTSKSGSEATNCDYYYTEKDSTLWDEHIKDQPWLRSYIPEKHFMVCVSVPTDANIPNYITNIAMFNM